MKNLINLRKNAGYSSQEEFAKSFGISKSTYSNYECGANEPSIETLIKLADFFGCSVDYLLGHETKGIIHLDSFSETQQKIIPLLQKLNDSQANYVLGWCSSTLGIPYDDVKPQRPW